MQMPMGATPCNRHPHQSPPSRPLHLKPLYSEPPLLPPRRLQVGKEDISASQYAYHDRGHVHEFQLRAATFYQTEQWHRTPDLSKLAHEDPTPFRRVPIPDDTTLGTFGDQARLELRLQHTVMYGCNGCTHPVLMDTYGDQALLELRSDWYPPGAPGGRSFAAGSLLTAPLDQAMDSDWSGVTALFEPDARGATSLQGYSATQK